MRALFCLFFLGIGLAASAQPVIGDSTYLRMPDRAKALEAMRFDLNAYNDTLRAYRDALDAAATRIDASLPDGDARRNRLGLLRRDAKALDKEMKALRKRMKRSAPAFEDCSLRCSDLIRRTRLLRTQLVQAGVRP